jgi:hypothetical protein
MSRVNRVSRKQVLEWIENPVTIAFRQMAEIECEEASGMRGIKAYRAFDPHKTQELMASLNAYVETWEYVIDALKGEGLWEQEDEE